MSQETTLEFASRLKQVVDSHPMSPPTLHGRQRWLLRKLEAEAGLELSPNTIHKWMTGTSRPREDNIRTLAKVLNVDEVWLALGRKPVPTGANPGAAAPGAQGAALLVAGLIEITGGRVTFAGPDDTVHLHANMGEGNIDLIAVVPQSRNGDDITFLVPEPAGDARILGVITPSGMQCSVCVNLLDLTNIPRINLGGFSLIKAEGRKDGKFKIAGAHNLLTPMPSLASLAAKHTQVE